MLIWGLLISIVITVVLGLCVANYKSGTFNVFTGIVGAVLLILLTIENTRLLNAIVERSQIDDIVTSMVTCIRNDMPEEDGNHCFSFEESCRITFLLKVSDPSMAKHIHVADFQGKNWESITSSLQKSIKKSVNRFIGYRVGWCILFSTVAIVFVLFIGMDKKSSRKISYTATSSKNYDNF